MKKIIKEIPSNVKPIFIQYDSKTVSKPDWSTCPIYDNYLTAKKRVIASVPNVKATRINSFAHLEDNAIGRLYSIKNLLRMDLLEHFAGVSQEPGVKLDLDTIVKDCTILDEVIAVAHDALIVSKNPDNDWLDDLEIILGAVAKAPLSEKTKFFIFCQKIEKLRYHSLGDNITNRNVLSLIIYYLTCYSPWSRDYFCKIMKREFAKDSAVDEEIEKIKKHSVDVEHLINGDINKIKDETIRRAFKILCAGPLEHIPVLDGSIVKDEKALEDYKFIIRQRIEMFLVLQSLDSIEDSHPSFIIRNLEDVYLILHTLRNSVFEYDDCDNLITKIKIKIFKIKLKLKPYFPKLISITL